MTDNTLHEKLSKTVNRLRIERQFKRDIINALHEGVIVFDKKKKIKVISEQAQKLLQIKDSNLNKIEDLPLYKNRKKTLRFDLLKWLETLCHTKNKDLCELSAWLTSSSSLTPLLFSAKPLLNSKNESQGILLIIYDRSVNEASAEQTRVLEAAFNSYDSQFITNEKGFITHPNATFMTYSGLTSTQLSKITISKWIDQQVSLKNGVSVKDILKTLLDEKKWSGEIVLHPDNDKNNKAFSYDCILSLSMLTDKDRNTEHYVGTMHDITDMKEAQAQIEHLSYYDDLTGLPNLRLITEHLQSALQHHLRYNTYTALLFIDLDNFKEINDIHSHNIGDQALQHIAHLFKDNLRSEDTLARISADEFVILTQYNSNNKEEVLQHTLTLSHKLNQSIEKDINISNIDLSLTASIGACIFPINQQDTPKAVLSYADLAMVEAKKRGKNQTYFYQTTLTDKVLKRREIETALKNADLDDEFFLAFQPQISTQSKHLSAEVLIRWINPELGFIPPDQFIAIAEDNKFILKLGEWITRTAFKQIKKWSTLYEKTLHISINVSPVQFRESNFVALIQQWQQEEDILPEWITLELTEGILIEDIEVALTKIKDLSDLGYQISIDDFGTGYSSLSYFQKLPIHELKIDQSFVNKLPGSPEDNAIVDTIIQLANSKKLIIVAEGAETEEQVKFFKSQSTPILIQGYFYSKPLKADEFEEKYLKQSNI